MKAASDFYVFGKWRDAGEFAFGGKDKPAVVPVEDKEAYWRILSELRQAAETAVAQRADGENLKVWPRPYSRERGARGHRPTDLWVAIHGSSAEPFGRMPQVYVIAASKGVEIGFAVSINEADYYSGSAKERNRLVVPLLNSKLPAASDALTATLDSALMQQGGWHFNYKNRLQFGENGFDSHSSLAELLAHLKSEGDEHGGGVICRLYSPEQLSQLDLEAEVVLSLKNFTPLLARCAPSPWDVEVLENQDEVDKLAAEPATFDPSGPAEGKKRVLAALARRQGQGAFRQELLAAYDGACAITGTKVRDVLQAAHITPYLGPSTNHVTNGLLLRADVHNLFDLRLLRVNPQSLLIEVSPALNGTHYEALCGVSLRLPSKPSQRPSKAALQFHYSGP